MTNADRLIKCSTVAAVGLVAIVAAVVSYEHAYWVVVHYGQTGVTAALLPATVDGTILCSSMITLYAARHELTARALARWTVVIGITATLAMNAVSGLGSGHGVPGAVVAGWPAVALVLSYELALWLIRASAARAVAQREGQAVPAPVTDVPASETVTVTEAVTKSAPEPAAKRAPSPSRKPGAATPHERAEKLFADEIAAGQVPRCAR